jgi:hypothetical protein
MEHFMNAIASPISPSKLPRPLFIYARYAFAWLLFTITATNLVADAVFWGLVLAGLCPANKLGSPLMHLAHFFLGAFFLMVWYRWKDSQ